MISTVWLTLNRACNFRCPWCYAEGTHYLNEKTMSLELAKALIDFSHSLGAKTFILIGGEPTLHPNFFEILEYIKSKNMDAALVTNGYRFSDKDFIKAVEDFLTSTMFSIKAANRKQQIKLTKTDSFEKIEQAIENLQEVKKFHVGYSTVISRSTIGNMEEFAQMLARLSPNSKLKYSLCNPSINKPQIINSEHIVPYEELAATVVSKWPQISQILNDRVHLEQSCPQCIWPKEFIDELKAKRQISFGCQIMSQKGLIFDTEGKVLVCNSLTDYPIAEFSKTFKDKESFEKFWKSDKIRNLYKKFYEYPKLECKTCEVYKECGGGCPLKHFVKKSV